LLKKTTVALDGARTNDLYITHYADAIVLLANNGLQLLLSALNGWNGRNCMSVKCHLVLNGCTLVCVLSECYVLCMFVQMPH